jgi:hypothetical protein
MSRPKGCARPYNPYYDSNLPRGVYDVVCGHYNTLVAVFITAVVAQLVVPLIMSLIGNRDCCQRVTYQEQGEADDQQRQQQHQPLTDMTSDDGSTPQPAYVRNDAIRRFLLRWLHCVSLSGQITVWFWLAVFIMSAKWSSRLMPTNMATNLLVISMVLWCSLAICIFFQSIYSCELQFIDNINSVSTVCQLVDQYGGIAEPVLMMTAESYHYVETSYYVSSANEGQGAWRTEQRKVVTSNHTSRCVFPFWRNVASPPDLTTLRATRRVAKVKVNMKILIGDTATFDEFNRQYTQFQTQHRHHDKHVDYDVIGETHAFKKRMVAVPDGVDVPWWMNKVCFYISACLTLGWVYHLVSWRTTNTFEYHVVKKVYVNRPSNADNSDTFVCNNYS